MDCEFGHDLRRPLRARPMPSISRRSDKQPAAQAEIFLAQDDARAGAAGRQRRASPAGPAPIDEHVAEGARPSRSDPGSAARWRGRGPAARRISGS